MDDLKEVISALIEQVMQDEDLHEEIKNQIVEMAQEVLDDPTSGNIKALGIVIDKLADMNKYLSAKATLDGLKLKEDLTQPVEDAETPAEDTAAPAETHAQ